MNQGALAGPSAMALKRVCVRSHARSAFFSTVGGELRSFRLSVVVAIEATPSCIDHGVRAIEALGRQIKEVIHLSSQVFAGLDLT